MQIHLTFRHHIKHLHPTYVTRSLNSRITCLAFGGARGEFCPFAAYGPLSTFRGGGSFGLANGACKPRSLPKHQCFLALYQPSLFHLSGPDIVVLYLLNCVLPSSTKMLSRVAVRHSSSTPRSIRVSSFRQLPRLCQRTCRQYATKPAEAAKKTSDLPW
jgi:hypothetical protein